MTVEFPRPVAVAKIGGAGLTIAIEATEAERAAVAARMDIPAIQSLACEFQLTREGDGVSFAAKGTLRALVTRVCVVSAEDFEAPVLEAFSVRFVPADRMREDIDPDEPDEVPYDGTAIDLGEAATEQLGLALDPYPRMPGAMPPEVEDDVSDSPFAALARVRREGET